MFSVFRYVEAIAASSEAVLITGETGVGKELRAKFIHEQSPRRDKPFEAVNVAGFSESLFERKLEPVRTERRIRDGSMPCSGNAPLFRKEADKVPAEEPGAACDEDGSIVHVKN